MSKAEEYIYQSIQMIKNEYKITICHIYIDFLINENSFLFFITNII